MSSPRTPSEQVSCQDIHTLESKILHLEQQISTKKATMLQDAIQSCTFMSPIKQRRASKLFDSSCQKSSLKKRTRQIDPETLESVRRRLTFEEDITQEEPASPFEPLDSNIDHLTRFQAYQEPSNPFLMVLSPQKRSSESKI